MPATDQWNSDVPAENAALVTPDDANDLAVVTRGLLVGTSGALKVTTNGGQTLVIPASCVVAGTLLPLRVKRVWATGTTASNIVAIW